MTNERLTDKRALVRIVDDDEDLLQALAFMLKSEGWEVKKQVSEDRKFAPPKRICQLFSITIFLNCCSKAPISQNSTRPATQPDR